MLSIGTSRPVFCQDADDVLVMSVAWMWNETVSKIDDLLLRMGFYTVHQLAHLQTALLSRQQIIAVDRKPFFASKSSPLKMFISY